MTANVALKPESQQLVDAWWADLFGVPAADLWTGVRIVQHRRLAEYEGVVAARRGDGIEVSVPSDLDPAIVRAIRAAGMGERGRGPLGDVTWWKRVAPSWTVVGPSRHHYLDSVAGLATFDDVERLGARDSAAVVAELRAATSADEWEESGIGEGSPAVVVRRDDAGVVALAARLMFRDCPSDIGVLVRPDARGRGHAHAVAAEATRDAISECGLARWRCAESNVTSMVLAKRLGFTSWVRQVAVRPGG